MKKINPTRIPFVLSLCIHAALFVLLLGQHQTEQKHLILEKKPHKIVQAVAVSEKQLKKEIQKIKSIEQAKRKAEIARAEKIKRERELARKKVLEQKRLAQLKKKQAEEKKRQDILEKKQKIEEAKRIKELKELEAKQTQEDIIRKEALARLAQIEGEVDKYKAQIIQAISQRWLIPEDSDETMTCKLHIRLGPGGVVLAVELMKSSGDTALDRSAKMAVFKASPLPVPTEPDIFDRFREIDLTVRPEGLLSG